MHHSKRFGCLVYPLLFLITLAVPGLIAQNSTGSGTPAPAPAQTQTEPENPQQNQVRLAQEAQARIRARRQARTQRVVEDTYSHKFEAYGGGGYTRFRPGSSLQHVNEVAWNGGSHRLSLGAPGAYGGLTRILRNRLHPTQSVQHLQAQHQPVHLHGRAAVSLRAQGALGHQCTGSGGRV